MGKWKITMDPVQEWGEEVEDGAIYGITLRREPVVSHPDPEAPNQGFVQYRTLKVRRLKAGTLDRLVTELMDPACQEPDYARIFLSTYRAFISTEELIEHLFHRKYVDNAWKKMFREDRVSERDHHEPQKSAMQPLIHTWLEEFPEDLWDPPQHHDLRLLSVHLLYRPCFRRLARSTQVLLKKFQEEDCNSKDKDLPVEEIQEVKDQSSLDEEEEQQQLENLDEPLDIMHWPAEEIAEQLTRLDAELFKKVVPFQCMGCVWSQRDKKESRNLAPTVRATIAQFNVVTNGVISSLLCCSQSLTGPAHRAQLIEKWVRVAQECKQLKNFSSLRAILSALQSNAVYRLKKTWTAVSRECVASFDQLCETFPDEHCVLTSREILVEDGSQSAEESPVTHSPKMCPRQMNMGSGIVPYLGTYLTVLTMLDTALPDTVEDGLINFEKRRREFEILTQIRQLQACCSNYNLPHQPRVTAWLQGLKLLSDQESYELSQALEPPLDPSPNSPKSWSHRLLTSLLSVTESASRKSNADQISVSSSGSSSSEMEELSTAQLSPQTQKIQPMPSPCHDTDPCPSPAGSTSSSSSTPSSSSSSPCPGLRPCEKDPKHVTRHQRCASMASLPVYNRQVDDSCIVRVSVESGNDGNIYKSILLTSQDKTAQVIQRALEKHNLEGVACQDLILCQLLPNDKELLIPDKAPVFYAMCSSVNYDFILRRRWRSHKTVLDSTFSLS